MRPLWPAVLPEATAGLTVEAARMVCVEVAVFAATLVVVRRVWPRTKDPWGLADLLTGLVLYPVLAWAAIQGSLETRHDVTARWGGATAATRFFQLLYVTRSLLHCIVLAMQPVSLMHKVLMSVHHVLSIAAYAGALLTGRCHHWAVLDGCCEITNIFLTNLFLCKEVTLRNKPLENYIPKWLYISNGALLWLSFIVFRLVLFPYWLYAFRADVVATPELTWDKLSWYELCLYPFANVFLLALSAMWFVSIHQGLVKAMTRQKCSNKPAELGEKAKAF